MLKFAQSMDGTTPLPITQIVVLMIVRLAEPISYTVIFPFINQMVEELQVTDNPDRVGFYSGLVESVFAFVQFFTVYHWAQLSDRIGRKPVLLLGLTGVAISGSLFGLANSFWTMIFFRSLSGALNGNVAVVKAAIGDITDESNSTEAFAMYGLTWTMGSMIGNAMGGLLSHPFERFPRWFGSVYLFQNYPYLLPCLVGAGLTVLGILFSLLFYRESLPGLTIPPISLSSSFFIDSGLSRRLSWALPSSFIRTSHHERQVSTASLMSETETLVDSDTRDFLALRKGIELVDENVEQAKLYRHLEKRLNKFNKKAANARHRPNRNRKLSKSVKPTFSTPSNASTSPPISSSTSSDTFTSTMISSSIRVSGRSLTQVIRPAVASASFSTTATAGARVQKKQSKKKIANPDALSASEATRVLRALEVAHPTSTYSLTLHTKSHKSALPIRGSFTLPLDPRRTSETILVFAEPSSPSATLAKEAGAAYVGGDELFEPVLSGKIHPTRCLATPGMMPAVTRSLARFLGPKGLMPVAKRGGVAEGEELAERIRDAAGKMEYRADKQGIVKVNVARVDFGIPSVESNIKSFIQTVRDNQAAANQTDDPLAAAGKSKKKKGSSITSVILESTNGPSIELNDVL